MMWGGSRPDSGKKKKVMKKTEKKVVDWNKYKIKKKAKDRKESSKSTKNIKSFFVDSKVPVKTSQIGSSDVTKSDSNVNFNNNNSDKAGYLDSSSSSINNSRIQSPPSLLPFFKNGSHIKGIIKKFTI